MHPLVQLIARVLPHCHLLGRSKKISKPEIMSAEQKAERIRESLVDYLVCPTHEEYLSYAFSDLKSLFSGYRIVLRRNIL
jgi:hypothetical protein